MRKQRNRGRYGGSDNSIKSDQKKNVKHGGTWEGKRNDIRWEERRKKKKLGGFELHVQCKQKQSHSHTVSAMLP